jgi:TPR repeat protein
MRKAVILLAMIGAGAIDVARAQQAVAPPRLSIQHQTDPAAALKKWWPLAHRGDAQAQYELGLLYGTGTAVALDLTESAKWHKLAAEQGHDRAQSMLGLFYNTGQGVPKNQAEAIIWWRKSAAQGNADARFNLGMAYWRGDGVPQDFDKAAVLFRKVAPAGNNYARSVFGTRSRPQSAVPSAAAQGTQSAPSLPPPRGTSTGEKKTQAGTNGGLFQQYLAAAERGDGNAQSQVAYMYAVGLGVKRDLIEAHKWANLSASRLAPGNVRDASIANRNAAAAKLSPGDILKAQQRARDWMEAFQQKQQR